MGEATVVGVSVGVIEGVSAGVSVAGVRLALGGGGGGRVGSD